MSPKSIVSFLLLIFVLICQCNFAPGAEEGGGWQENAPTVVLSVQKSYGYAETPKADDVEKPDYSVCSRLPKRRRRACKMSVQIEVEARKAERQGLLEDDELPPPSQGLGLPSYRKPTKQEEEAQAPPKVIAERYACMNMTCLCPYLGGTSSGPDHCEYNAGASSNRTTRQSGNPNWNLGRVVRKEYRMLTDNERNRYHAAVQQLKRGFGSYEYNRIAYLHVDLRAMPSAHTGPTFPLWHREYLKRYEIGLRAIDPMVSIPYWDSSLDQRLPNPADSMMWSANFMGSPDGRGGIADGFLANWITMSGTPIQRRLGEDGELITEEEVNAMIGQRLMDNVFAFPSRQNNGGCRRPNPNPEDVVELNHNNVHTWIGGDMASLPTAPQDPVFFMHHCFIDYIWEQWRLRWQSRTQRETEFPTDREVDACSGSVNYRLSATMRPFQDPVVLNRVGLSNDYTDFLYTYAPRPTCRSAGGCGSPYLFCDTTKRTPLCCAKIKPGGDCSTFRGNREQPCYASTCGGNGRCSGGPRVARRSPDRSSSESSYNATNVGYGASSGERNGYGGGGSGEKRGYGGGGYGHKTSPTTTTPPTYPTTTSAEEYTTPSPTPAPPKERVCYDNHECCAHWAAKDACKTAPRYMNTWCPGSCNYDGCKPQPQQQRAAGKDRYLQCKRWSKFHEHYGRAEGWRTYRPNRVLKREKLRNECERNPHWMACNCPEACSSVKRKTDECTKHFPKDYLLEPLDDN